MGRTVTVTCLLYTSDAADEAKCVDLGGRRIIKKRKTILLIEHDMDVVFALADRITVLVYGQVIASGSPQSIKKNEKVREAYLGSDGEMNC